MTANNDNDLSLENLYELIKAFDITYKNTCKEKYGRNVSNIDGIPISILNLKEQRTITDLNREGSNFMWKTLLIDCLINMDYQVDDNRDELVQYLKEKYPDPKQLKYINEFHKTYKSTDAIRWYKEQSCIFQELNHVLRLNCINIILVYRFFLRDLSSQLRKEQKKFPKKNHGNIVNLYRGQRTSIEEIERLQKLKVGSLISVDSFLSTSRSETAIDVFMRGKEEDDHLIPLRYEIKCDLTLKSKPYADVSPEELGPFSLEEEVLFMVGTLFKFKGMFFDEERNCWAMKLELFDENNNRLSKLYQSIRDEMGEETDLLTLAGLLMRAGDHEHALRIYLRSFFDLMISDGDLTEYGERNLAQSLMGIANVLCDLGRYEDSIDLFNITIQFINNHQNLNHQKDLLASVHYSKSLPLSEKGDYSNALKQCKYALTIFIKYMGKNDLFIASCYEMIGNIYGNIGRLQNVKHDINGQYRNFEKANHFYNKALEIRKRIHHKTPDHYEVTATYLNIGELYRDIGKSDEALEYTLTAYESFVKIFPKSHHWIGIALDNIGEIYVQQQQFDQAREIYDQAIDVFKQTFPNDHRFIGETYHNIGKLYCCTYQFDKALHYFIKAKQIYDKKIPKYHYLVVELHKQISYVTAQLH